MNTLNRIVLNVIFCIQVLLIFLLFVEDQVQLPAWLQVAGRFHPLILHLPIGFTIFLLVIIFIQRHLDKNSAYQIIHIGLLITSLSASLAALFGFFLSLQGEYGVDSLERHKISGVVLSWLCYAALLWHMNGYKKMIFFGLGTLTIATLIVAGHTGSILTHGENFLLAPISQSENTFTVDNASVYQFAVQPILEKKCYACHNEVKAKGGLVMTNIDKFKKGGKNGKEWVEGKPKESRMIKALYLPLNHDEHMPPDGKPQLTAVEISTLEAWIKSGADFEKKLNQFAEGDSLKFIVASFAASQINTPVVEKEYDFPAVSSETIEKLNSPFRSVFPLYQNSPALQADFFLRESFTVKALEELKSVKNQLVVLNLSKMPITDKELTIISTFKNLEILNLNFTMIDGNGLASLQTLKNLQSLTVAGTSVKANDLEGVLKLPKLREVYIWNTKITEADRKALSKKYPEIKIIGSQFTDSKILKLSKPRVENEGVIEKGELVSIKHSMPGVSIRLSKDGAEPDSVNSEIYKEPFSLDETIRLKVKACKEGWYCSEVFEVTCFAEGIPPRHVELLNPSDIQYPGEGVSSLTDRRKGFPDVFKDPTWLGYRDQAFSAAFDFSENVAMKNVVISYGKSVGAYIFPPDEVELWAGNDMKQLELLKKIKVVQPAEYVPPNVEALIIPTESKTAYRFYKIVAKPLAKLPAWHDAKKEKGWFFVDEVFFY
jgi:hypothetical protein